MPRPGLAFRADPLHFPGRPGAWHRRRIASTMAGRRNDCVFRTQGRREMPPEGVPSPRTPGPGRRRVEGGHGLGLRPPDRRGRAGRVDGRNGAAPAMGRADKTVGITVRNGPGSGPRAAGLPRPGCTCRARPAAGGSRDRVRTWRLTGDATKQEALASPSGVRSRRSLYLYCLSSRSAMNRPASAPSGWRLTVCPSGQPPLQMTGMGPLGTGNETAPGYVAAGLC